MMLRIAAFLVAVVVFSAVGAPVDEAMARKAIGAWRVRGGVLGLKMGRTVRDVRRVEKDGAAFHVVRFEGGGMAISPTDTTIRPVIMFSEEDDFDENPDNPAWDLLVPELAARARQIASRKMKAAAPAAVRRSDCEAEWAELLLDLQYDKVGDDAMDDIRVPSLVKTRWNQGSAGGGYCYNYYTPEHHVCGCVATAMAQAMRYLEYPASTTEVPRFTNRRCSFLGTRTEYTTQGGFYDWSKMPYVPSSGMSEEERQAIGKLTSDLGIMLGANYGYSGTGATSPAVQYVFTKCLGYANAISIQYDVGAWWGIDDEYAQMMMSNFDAKLPVVIALNGHEILGDGYGYRNGSLYYHLNFGWSGAAWYKPAKNEEGMEGYHVFYGAIFNIYTTRTGNPEIASGRVTDAAGRPVKGLTVKAARASSPDEVVATAVTDDNGIYAAFVPPDDCYRISAEILYEDGRGRYFGTYDAKVGKSVSREVFLDTGLITIGTYTADYLMPYALYHGTPNCSIGNVAQCDIQLRGENFDPEATVTVGTVTVGRDFSEVVVPVTAKVVHYGQTATSAKVVVTLTPASGGTVKCWESDEIGDFEGHGLNASFEGLDAGVTYRVEAKVVMIGTSEEAGLGDGSFSAAREFTWFDESAASFSAAKWSGGEVKVEDDGLFVGASDGAEATFTPDAASLSSARVNIAIRESDAYAAGNLPTPGGPVAVSAVLRTRDRAELVVWGNGAWNSTGLMFEEEKASIDVVIDLDFLNHRVSYVAGGAVLGPYDLPNSVTTVSSVAFKGYYLLSGLNSTAWDANLVRDAKDAEYATYAAAKEAGATGVLSPLWLSTWNLTGGSGTVDVTDPLGLITFTGDSKVLRSETNTQGVVTHWYAQASDADIEAGVGKYVKTTVDLGLAKAITDESVVKIGDYAVAEGAMTFKVEVDDVEVAKATINDLVEVSGDLDMWARPADKDIAFDLTTHVITVTPPAGPRGFVRVKVPEE